MTALRGRRRPVVTGLFRPAVVLPAWFAQDYSRTEARAAIAHELTHVKRGDLWALQFIQGVVMIMALGLIHGHQR